MQFKSPKIIIQKLICENIWFKSYIMQLNESRPESPYILLHTNHELLSKQFLQKPNPYENDENYIYSFLR